MSLEQTEREFAELAKSLKEALRAFSAGDYLRAEELYSQALSLCDKLWGDDHHDTCLCLQNLSDTYYTLRKYGDAIPLLRRLLVAKQKVEPANAEIASILFKLSRTYDKLGQYTESEAFYRITARMGEQLYGPESTFVASTLEGLLKTLRRANRTKDADQLEERLVLLRAKLASGATRGASAMLSHLADSIAPAMGQTDGPITLPPGGMRSPTNPGSPSQNPSTQTYLPGDIPIMPIGGANAPISPIDTFPPTKPQGPANYPMGHSQYDAPSPGRSGFDTIPPGGRRDTQERGSTTPPTRRETIPPGGRRDAVPPGKGSLSESIPPGTPTGPHPMRSTRETGETHRPTGLRFKNEDIDGSHLPAAARLNDSQKIAIVLSISLVGFLAFCFYTLMSLKTSDKGLKAEQKQALALLFPDGLNHSDKPDVIEHTKTPIYRTADGTKQITLLDAEHALMTARGLSLNATYTVSNPYVLLTPEGQTTSYSFQQTEDSLIDRDGNTLYAPWAPELTVISEMKALAETATKYYRMYHNYPARPEQLMEATRIISFTNPTTHQASWPTRRMLLGISDEFTDVNMTDFTNLQNAAKDLHVWKANETIEPCSVEYYRVPVGPRRDAFLIRGSDRTGHILRSSTPGLTDMIVCMGGTIRE